MSDSTPGLPPAGWYPDPAGGPARRWWDGSRWTERIEAPQFLPDPVLPTSIAPSTPVAAPGVSPSTWAIWVVAMSPILLIIGIALWDVEGYFRRLISEVAVAQNPGAMPSLNIFAITGPTFLLLEGLSVLSLAAFIVFAALDYRILRSRGVDRPFHWAWSFFTLINPGWLVYLIGRTVVARRRTGRSASAPMWVYIGLMLVVLILSLVKVFGALANLGPLLEQYSNSLNG